METTATTTTDLMLSSATGEAGGPLSSFLPVCCVSYPHSAGTVAAAAVAAAAAAAATPACSVGGPLAVPVPVGAPALLPEGLLLHHAALALSAHPFAVPTAPAEAAALVKVGVGGSGAG